MAKIKFITDTASDISLKQAEEAGIELLSFTIMINGESYQEQRDLSKEAFYQLMANTEDMPSTSQITAFTFQEVFQQYAEQDYTDLIYVSINSSGSATYQNAEQAREQFYAEFPDAKNKVRIHLLDGGNYTMCYGYPVLQAAKMADSGASVEEILSYLENWLAHVGVYFTPMTLKYVKKSGRLTSVAAFAGEVLGLRPIIHIKNGKITTAEKVRGEKNIVPRLADKIISVIQDNSPYILLHGSNPVYADQMEKLLTQKLGYAPADRALVGSAVAVNAGHDLIAVIMLEKQD